MPVPDKLAVVKDAVLAKSCFRWHLIRLSFLHCGDESGLCRLKDPKINCYYKCVEKPPCLTLKKQQLTWLYETSFICLNNCTYEKDFCTSNLWALGLAVALEVDEQLATPFHGPKKSCSF